MVSFFKTFLLLFIFAASTAYSLPGFPNPMTKRDADLYRRDPIDWGNYVYIASIFSGVVGQNIGLIALPGASLCLRRIKWRIELIRRPL